MRVTFASYDDSPALGGQGVMLGHMRAALEQRGVAVHTVSGRGDHAVRYPRILHRAPLDFSLQLNRTPRLLERTEPDVVHALGGPGGVLLLRRLSMPLVYTANHTYRQAYGRRAVKRTLAPLEARAYCRAGRVLALSRSTADALLAMGVPGRRVEVLMPGVDVGELPAAQREPQTVLFVGRLEPEKGALDAVLVMLDLIGAGVAAHCVVVGSGSLATEIARLVRHEPRITARGVVSREELERCYATASILLMPSRYEGLGLVALEAQAAGTPVVGYDVDGLRDAVAGDGVLVPPGERAALRAAAAALLSDPVRCEELGASARQRMREEHAWPVVAKRLEQIYDAVRSR